MLFASVYILRTNLLPRKTVEFLRHCRSHIPLLYGTVEKGIYIVSYFSLLIRGAFLTSGRFTLCLSTSETGGMKRQHQPQGLKNCHTDHHLPPEASRYLLPSSHRTGWHRAILVELKAGEIQIILYRKLNLFYLAILNRVGGDITLKHLVFYPVLKGWFC